MVISQASKTLGGTSRPKKKRNSQTGNPLQRGIYKFLLSHQSFALKLSDPSNIESQSSASPSPVIEPSTLPKRYTLYPPLLLLPSAFPTHPLISSIPPSTLPALYACIQQAFSTVSVTHIALQAPIPASVAATTTASPSPSPLHSTPNTLVPNTTRSPTGLVPLYGKWPSSPSPSSVDADAGEQELWVHHTENAGIVQTWAPRRTMFSRGNVREKARIREGRIPGLSCSAVSPWPSTPVSHGPPRLPLADTAVLDMYVGIGYFAFSYLKAGVGRVWGWELNAWSVEGCRRGAGENGWGCEVVSVNESGAVDGEGGVESLVRRVHEKGKEDMRLVVFHGDNRWAGTIMGQLRTALGDGWMGIKHVNLGLLPTSQPAWRDAVEVLGRDGGGWAHAHENVEEEGIDGRREEVVRASQGLCDAMVGGGKWVARCEHVERVKTFAPGVMHCVFDVEIAQVEDNTPP